MAHIITGACIDVKDKSCVPSCPVDCIHEGENQLFIDPEECIDCGNCVDECPVDAIYYEEDLPEADQKFVKINADFFKPESS